MGVAIAQTTFPPPPYAVSATASSEGNTRLRAGAPVYDRYGGGVVHAPVAQANAPYPTRPAYTGPRLAWGGKSTEAPQLTQVPAARPWTTAQARTPLHRSCASRPAAVSVYGYGRNRLDASRSCARDLYPAGIHPRPASGRRAHLYL